MTEGFLSWILICLIFGHIFFRVPVPSNSWSHLLCVTDEQLMTIYHYCGFYNVKINCFYDTAVQSFVEGLNVLIGITRYKNPTTKINSLLMKIGQGSYPSKPLHQVQVEKRREAASGYSTKAMLLPGARHHFYC
jgi:hypothetical protein